MRGTIQLKIKYVNKSLTCEITLPANMQAEVVFPSIKNVLHNKLVVKGEIRNGTTKINIGSGHHFINGIQE
jgi:hypothetical protein